jgi:hypothetical protein
MFWEMQSIFFRRIRVKAQLKNEHCNLGALFISGGPGAMNGLMIIGAGGGL